MITRTLQCMRCGKKMEDQAERTDDTTPWCPDGCRLHMAVMGVHTEVSFKANYPDAERTP